MVLWKQGKTLHTIIVDEETKSLMITNFSERHRQSTLMELMKWKDVGFVVRIFLFYYYLTLINIMHLPFAI